MSGAQWRCPPQASALLRNDWADLPPPQEFLAHQSPHIDVEGVPACPVCGSGRFEPVAIGFDYESLTCRNPWRFVRCGVCAHVWLNPRPALSTLPIIYPPTYYAYDYSTRVSSLAVKGKALLDRFKMNSILRHCRKPVRAYLDIGCGDGHFLRVLEARGLSRDRLYGIDLDERAIAALVRQGYRAFCERVEICADIPPGTFDLVTMFHVIEHVDKPAAVLQRILSWLAPGGILAVETPNIHSFDARLFQEGYWGGYHIPRHWNLFHPASLARLLADNGYTVTATEFQTGHSFWMYSFHHALRYGDTPQARFAKWFDPFSNLPLLTLFTGFDRLRATIGYKTSAMLMIASKD